MTVINFELSGPNLSCNSREQERNRSNHRQLKSAYTMEFANANEAFMSLQAAVSVGDIFPINVLLEWIPDARELEDRVGHYVTLWSGYIDDQSTRRKKSQNQRIRGPKLQSSAPVSIEFKLWYCADDRTNNALADGDTVQRRLVCNLEALNTKKSTHFPTWKYWDKCGCGGGRSKDPFQIRW